MNELIINIIEFGFGMAMFANSVLFIPQIIRLYKTKDSKDVSALTFAGFNVIQILSILHGYINGDYKLMYGMMLTFILCIVVTIMILYYRNSKITEVCDEKR
ncbi:MAG: hypothetical protein KA998_01965 [Rickettsiaceae bacterium]|nr:hypothetical protein [Rickettsiaceae bacterium]